MKKLLSILLVIVIGFIIGFRSEKKIKVELTVEQWNLIYDCVDKSNAPHWQVKQVFEMLNKQIVPQIDTTKKK